jgi:peptidyl-tRNA hydrolase
MLDLVLREIEAVVVSKLVETARSRDPDQAVDMLAEVADIQVVAEVADTPAVLVVDTQAEAAGSPAAAVAVAGRSAELQAEAAVLADMGPAERWRILHRRRQRQARRH